MLSVGCQGLRESIDSLGFQRFGGTLFSSPRVVKASDLHLGLMDGQHVSVVVEGVTERLGELGTYAVLAEESGTILVLLTEQTVGFRQRAKLAPGQALRILGQVERGKKGSPVLRARTLFAKASAGAVELE